LLYGSGAQGAGVCFAFVRFFERDPIKHSTRRCVPIREFRKIVLEPVIKRITFVAVVGNELRHSLGAFWVLQQTQYHPLTQAVAVQICGLF
jgi:hypothetical protein